MCCAVDFVYLDFQKELYKIPNIYVNVCQAGKYVCQEVAIGYFYFLIPLPNSAFPGIKFSALLIYFNDKCVDIWSTMSQHVDNINLCIASNNVKEGHNLIREKHPSKIYKYIEN